MSITNIVDVQITRQTAAVSQAGFGTLLIAGTGASFGEALRYYTDMAGVVEDFATSDAEYIAANAAFSQTPRPVRVGIGKLAANTAAVYLVDFNQNLQAGDSVSLVVNGTTVTGETLVELETAIEAIDGVAGVVVDGALFTLTITAVAGRTLSVSDLEIETEDGLEGTLTNPTPGVTVATGLSAIQLANDDWYALTLTNQTLVNQLEAARWVESRKKIFSIRSNASGVKDGSSTTDIAAVLQTGAFARSFVTYNAPATDAYIDSAWPGKLLPEAPGSATWAFKTLAGVPADILTATEEQAILDKNANVYTTRGGVNITYDGKMASGEYIDIIIGTDWLQSRIQERVYARLVNLKKVPFTDAGVAIIESEIRAQLQEAVTVGLIAASPEFVVTVPLVANVSSQDKANRFLPDITFTATLAGAVHKVQIRGTVSV